ncbi:MAG: ASKHA domain-containing protein, partial [Desulfosarcina sp.]
GMLPDLPLTCYHSLGNSSLGGAARVLEDAGCIDRINAIRDGITYLELNVNHEFMNRFSAARFLPHTDRSLFPSVAIPAGGDRPD